jgi:Bacterial SH3 domain
MGYHIRIWTLICSVAVLIPFFCDTSMAQSTADDTYYVANTRPPDAFLALRTNPSTKVGQRIATMPNGTLLKVLQRNGDGWWYVRMLPSGPEGWAMSRQGNLAWIVCCASDRDGGQARAEPLRREQTCVVIDTSPPLNVRDMPNGKIIGGLDRGDKVIVNQGPITYKGGAWANVSPLMDLTLRGWVFWSLLGSCIWETVEGE